MAGVSGHPQAQEEMGNGMFVTFSHFWCMFIGLLQAVTIPATLAGFVGGISYFGNLEMDPSKPIFVRMLSPMSSRTAPVEWCQCRTLTLCSYTGLLHLAVLVRSSPAPLRLRLS